jgi:hypothetical protein
MEKLINQIRKVEKPSLSADKKRFLKANILAQLENRQEYPASLRSVISYIRDLVGDLDFVNARKTIKVNVFRSIEAAPQNSCFWARFFVFQKKLVSGTLVLMISFGMFSFLGVETQVVRAETLTTLENFSGDIYLEREGKEFKVEAGMEIFEKDKLVTGEDGTAVIKYFDDSVNRLGVNTQVVVNRLFKDEINQADSQVEVLLINGSVWAKVINLVGENSAFVVQAKDVYTSAKKAAFNVEVKEEKVEVQVFNRSVDLQKSDGSEKVMTGQKALVNGNVYVSELNDDEKETQWVKQNLESDKVYVAEVEEKILAENKEIAEEESLAEKVNLALTFDEISKKKKELNLAEKEFITTRVLLEDEKLSEEERSEAEEVLKVFVDEIEDFYSIVDDVAERDENYSGELRSFVDEKILLHKKQLSSVVPDSNLYSAKQVIDEASLLGVSDGAEFAEKKIGQIEDKLAEVEDLVVEGEEEIAQEILEEYEIDLENVQIVIDAIDEEGDVKEELQNDVADLGEYKDQVTENEEEVIVEIVEIEVIIEEEKFGIKVYGDKPLPPGLD